MTMIIERWPAGVSHVDEFWHGRSAGNGSFMSVAATHWELVVALDRDRVPTVTLRGPATRACRLSYAGGGTWWGIRFRIGAYIPQLSHMALVDAAVNLPIAGDQVFSLGGTDLPLTNFADAERVAHRLVETGVVVMEPLVDALRQGAPPGVSARTVQRRFRDTTGISRRTAYQIDRAASALRLLQHGESILDTVHELGYSDQAHLTRSLRRWMGQTPASVVPSRGEAILS